MNNKKLIVNQKKYGGDSSVISARIPVSLIRRIDNIADKTGRTRNEIMLLCLEFAVDNLIINKNEEE
jgi:hypothetical protein